MGTTLTGTTPQDTYDSLIKVTDNGPLTGSLKKLTDGLGNDSTLSLSTGAAKVDGLLSVAAFTTSDLSTSPQLSLTRTATQFTGIAIRGSVAADRALFSVASDDALHIGRHAGGGGAWEKQVSFLDNGNVGIGTSSPSVKLDVESGIEGITAGFAGATYGVRIDNGGTFSTDASTIHGVNSTLTASYQPLRLNGSFTALCANNTEVVRATANGLTFNGDTAAANALDDYEEGTFTPTLNYSTSGTPTYAIQSGLYTKIGRSVQVQVVLSWNENGAVGNISLQGLPFTAATSSARAVPSIMSFGLTGLTTAVSVTGLVVSNGTAIDLFLNDNAATTLTSTYTDNDQDIFVTLTYQAA